MNSFGPPNVWQSVAATMTQERIYDLGEPSEGFYGTLAAFTGEVLDRLRRAFPDELLGRLRPDHRREGDEKRVELLSLGVYWRGHGGLALRTASRERSVLLALRRTRARTPTPERSAVDRAIGRVLASLPDAGAAPVGSPTVHQLRRLLAWLRASGEFRAEVPRLRPWIAPIERSGDTSTL